MSFPVLRVSCADRPGLVRTITDILADAGANIVRNDEFVDRIAKLFFMRTAFENIAPEKLPAIEKAVKAAVPNGDITLSLPRPKKIAVLATREYHVLGDILLRHHFNELGAKIEIVISNHEILRDLVERFGIAFHYVPHENLSREDHEDAVLKILEPFGVDYVVLAKYMRVLSPAFVSRFAGKMINIHHSFLPAFVGAKPYQQAYARGVKKIGATAHFVTNDLDEGPIIAQDVVAVDHTDDPASLSLAGREIESAVLARAVKLVFSDRVFISGNKTVVF